MTEMHPEITDEIAAALRQAVSEADRPRLEMLFVAHARHVKILRATVGEISDPFSLSGYTAAVAKMEKLEEDMRRLAGWY